MVFNVTGWTIREFLTDPLKISITFFKTAFAVILKCPNFVGCPYSEGTYDKKR